MERKTPFYVGEIYHLYTRGVEKRIVFIDEKDSERMLALLFAANSKKPVRSADSIRKSRGESSRFAGERLVEIIAYALMPNHLHLVVKETNEGGISKFMHKAMTGYSMYFNTKYERSGPLFTRPFRSKHVDSDEYFRWLFSYVLLNPLSLHQVDWKENGVRDTPAAAQFLKGYRYASFSDYFAEEQRKESDIIEKNALPIPFGDLGTFDSLVSALSEENDVFERQGTL